MNLYANYTYYLSIYRGDLTEEEFERFIIPATAHVRRITFGRADQNMGLKEVQLATCAICDLLANDKKFRSQHSGKAVISENTDGYSVTYESGGNGDTADDLLIRKIYKTAELYLESTDLLYAGVE